MVKRFDISNFDKMFKINLLNSTALSSIVKQQERLNDLIKPAALEFYKNQNKLNDIIKPSTLEIIKSQQSKFNTLKTSQAFQKLIDQQAETNTVFNKLVLNFAKKLSETSSLSKMMIENNKANSLLSASILNSIKIAPSILSKINYITETLNYKIIQPEILMELDRSFSFKLVKDLSRENITLDETIDIVQQSFSKKLVETPHSLISFEGMVQIFLAIILFIYAQASTLESEERITKKIEQLESQVMEQLAKLAPKNESAIYYIVKRRAVYLRADSNTKSTIISVLHPNQRVELILRKKKWIYIKYFDYLDGIQKIGWVSKKYLKLEGGNA